MDGKVKITLSISPSLLKVVDKEAKKMGLDRSSFVELILRYYLKEEELSLAIKEAFEKLISDIKSK